MSNPLFLFSIFFVAHLFHLSHGDVGTATPYGPPYLPTACAGNDFSMFPTTNLFAAAGEGIWENGAACGRQYLVRCLSSAVPKACVPDQTIQVTIVDRAISTVSKAVVPDTTMTLSTTAYKSIVKGATSLVKIEFTQA
ncbi:EG45-like domain containing protein [Benincasa hispida]|uniref:EG45-like domain containing protein n=1 Tax=Benincasa hispida TaxID=102211 RepID=UPI001900FDDA|nr:EG45-like domain containing protein [Benincasa hispida]